MSCRMSYSQIFVLPMLANTFHEFLDGDSRNNMSDCRQQSWHCTHDHAANSMLLIVSRVICFWDRIVELMSKSKRGSKPAPVLA